MTRRFLGLLAGALALPALASCATFDTDDAAVVNGTSISSDDLEALREGLVVGGSTIGIDSASYDDTGAAGGELTRQALSLLVDNAVLAQLLEERGRPVTDAELADVDAQIRESAGEDLPAGLLDPLVYRQAASVALAEIGAPDDAAIQAAYAEQPATLGVICVRVVGAPDKEAATAAAEALEAGTEVATTDGTTNDTGCAGVADLLGGLGPDVAAELVAARPGHVTDVIAPQAGTGSSTWQVLQVLEYEEAAAPLADALAAQDASTLAHTGALVAADVSVDSTYGKWDPVTQSVVAV